MSLPAAPNPFVIAFASIWRSNPGTLAAAAAEWVAAIDTFTPESSTDTPEHLPLILVVEVLRYGSPPYTGWRKSSWDELNVMLSEARLVLAAIAAGGPRATGTEAMSGRPAPAPTVRPLNPDQVRQAAISQDPLARLIHDFIEKLPAAMRLYPDLYAVDVADTIRAAAPRREPATGRHHP